MVKIKVDKVCADLLWLEGLLGLHKEAIVSHQKESLNENVRSDWLPNEGVGGASLGIGDRGDRGVMVKGVNANSNHFPNVITSPLSNMESRESIKEGYCRVNERYGQVKKSSKISVPSLGMGNRVKALLYIGGGDRRRG